MKGGMNMMEYKKIRYTTFISNSLKEINDTLEEISEKTALVTAQIKPVVTKKTDLIDNIYFVVFVKYESSKRVEYKNPCLCFK
jgi:hypothetical protein